MNSIDSFELIAQHSRAIPSAITSQMQVLVYTKPLLVEDYVFWQSDLDPRLQKCIQTRSFIVLRTQYSEKSEQFDNISRMLRDHFNKTA